MRRPHPCFVLTVADGIGRRIEYLRISVADACNLRCVYCMPSSGMHFTKFSSLLSAAQIGTIARAAASLGTKTVRITGGEPLMRHDICDIAAEISGVEGIEDVPISTNAMFLADKAHDLRKAGVTRANISLDTLNAERFRAITRGGKLDRVLEGIDAAQDAGIWPIKINTVLMKGVNSDELERLTLFALDRGFSIRFIEMMPLKSNADFQPELFYSAQEAKQVLMYHFHLTPFTPDKGAGPSVNYKVDGYEGSVGFITPLSGNFCSRCNRIRVTSDGRLRLCLFGDSMVDLRNILNAGGGVREIAATIRNALTWKPERHYLDIGRTSSETLHAMSQIGG
ncbi:MAG: GTP 3',8-cyclase MoaA [Methanomassiliicoccales archaeon]